MHPELLVLSGEVALLVLIASAFAAFLAWWWRGRLAQAALHGIAEESGKHRADEDKIQQLRVALNESEQQCMAALEQRDEAERLSLLRAGETRQLQKKVADGEIALSESVGLRSQVEALRIENASLKSDVSNAASKHEKPAAETAVALDTLAKELALLRQSHAMAEQALSSLRAEYVVTERALQTEREARSTDATQHAAAMALLRAEHLQLQQQRSETEALENLYQAEVERLKADAAQASQRFDELAGQEAIARGRIAELEAIVADAKRVSVTPSPIPMSAKNREELPLPTIEGVDFMAFPSAPSREVVKVAPKAKKTTQVGAAMKAPIPPADASTPTVAEREALVGKITAERERLSAELGSHDPHALDRIGLTRIRLAEVDKRLTTAITERDRLMRQAHATAHTIAEAPDDLSRIKGIKSILMKKLHAHGIYTFRQIAEWTDEDAAVIGDLLAFKNRIFKDRWREQARELQAAKAGE